MSALQMLATAWLAFVAVTIAVLLMRYSNRALWVGIGLGLGIGLLTVATSMALRIVFRP